MADDQLQLRYDFLPSPNPIVASQAGANPATVDLQVMVSNSGTYAVAMSRISITIPVGADVAGTLSSAPALPQPYADAVFPWDISVAGGTVTLSPRAGTPGTISGTLLFTIPGIAVNETPGNVPITITEFPPGGGKVTDTTSYVLVKQPDDTAVTSFRADPPVITSLDAGATLYWACTPAGHGYVYALRSDDSWQPSDCLEQGNCLTWQDGETGVATPPLSQAMVFYLDVIGTGTGVRKVITTVQLPVPVAVPQVSQNSFTRQSSVGTGRLVSVHWVAYNAARCSVLLDGSPVVEDAPVDTYLHGYPLVLPAAPGTYQLAVVAHALSGDTTASQVLPDVIVRGLPAAISVGTLPRSVAITPDGALALVTDLYQTLSVVDIAARTTRTRIPIAGEAGFVAVTPDGTLALVAQRGINGVHVVNLATLQAESGVLPVGTPHAIAVTPDGAFALVACEEGIYTADIPGRRVEPGVISTQGVPTGLSISADGQRAVACYASVNALAVIDVPNRRLDGEPILLGGFPADVALTPDGSFALICMPDAAELRVMDLSTRTVEPNVIAVGSQPVAVALGPDGRLALVCNIQDGTASLVDVPGRCLATGSIPAGTTPRAAAFGPDGLMAVVVSDNDSVLTVI